MGCGLRGWAIVALAVGLHGAARSAEAQTDPMEEARVHFERAVGLFEAGDLRAALVEFERAYALSSRPSLLFNLGATHQALHEYPEAIDALRRFLAATEGQRSRQRTEAERAAAGAAAADGEGARGVRSPDGDGDPRRARRAGDVLSVGPGRHVIEASSPGRVTQRVEVTVASGDAPSLRLVLPELPAPVVSAPGGDRSGGERSGGDRGGAEGDEVAAAAVVHEGLGVGRHGRGAGARGDDHRGAGGRGAR
jgi:hypothetical protein